MKDVIERRKWEEGKTKQRLQSRCEIQTHLFGAVRRERGEERDGQGEDWTKSEKTAIRLHKL